MQIATAIFAASSCPFLSRYYHTKSMLELNDEQRHKETKWKGELGLEIDSTCARRRLVVIVGVLSLDGHLGLVSQDGQP
jgi:hypothetical protein